MRRLGGREAERHEDEELPTRRPIGRAAVTDQAPVWDLGVVEP
jgi:hypothetical protein